MKVFALRFHGKSTFEDTRTLKKKNVGIQTTENDLIIKMLWKISYQKFCGSLSNTL